MCVLTHDEDIFFFFLERKVVMYGPHNFKRLLEGRDL